MFPFICLLMYPELCTKFRGCQAVSQKLRYSQATPKVSGIVKPSGASAKDFQQH